MIKARGEAAMNQPEPDTSKRFEVVDLAEGSYEFCGAQTFKFKIEAGGVICGDNIDGSIQNGKVLFKAGDKHYEGTFVS